MNPMSYFLLQLERNESTSMCSIVLHLENKKTNLRTRHFRLREPAVAQTLTHYVKEMLEAKAK